MWNVGRVGEGRGVMPSSVCCVQVVVCFGVIANTALRPRFVSGEVCLVRSGESRRIPCA